MRPSSVDQRRRRRGRRTSTTARTRRTSGRSRGGTGDTGKTTDLSSPSARRRVRRALEDADAKPAPAHAAPEGEPLPLWSSPLIPPRRGTSSPRPEDLTDRAKDQPFTARRRRPPFRVPSASNPDAYDQCGIAMRWQWSGQLHRGSRSGRRTVRHPPPRLPARRRDVVRRRRADSRPASACLKPDLPGSRGESRPGAGRPRRPCRLRRSDRPAAAGAGGARRILDGRLHLPRAASRGARLCAPSPWWTRAPRPTTTRARKKRDDAIAAVARSGGAAKIADVDGSETALRGVAREPRPDRAPAADHPAAETRDDRGGPRRHAGPAATPPALLAQIRIPTARPRRRARRADASRRFPKGWPRDPGRDASCRFPAPGT